MGLRTMSRLSSIFVLPMAIAACDSGSDDGWSPASTAKADGGGDGSSADASDGAPAKDGASPLDASNEQMSDAAGDQTDEPPAAAFTYFDINHVLCTGQSLSVGAAGEPALSTAQPFKNKMFNTGVLAGGANLLYMVPLVEASVETMSSGMANLITQMARDEVFAGEPPPQDSHDVLVSCHGVGGIAYTGLKKGTAPFANGLAQVKAGKEIADFYGLSYVVRAVTNVHGESDHVAGNASYAADLATWQSDYETETKALTQQTEPVPMLHTQMSSWTKYGQATSAIPGAQLEASVAAPDKLILVGPKYFLAYAGDGVHLSNAGYRHMGEYYAKAYRQAILEGKTWQPLRPLKATLQGAAITIDFQVPVPPLAIDTTLVTDPGHNGFEYTDESASPPAITSVALAGPASVKVTLASAPTGAQKHIRYAQTGTAGAGAGPTTGPRGNLRDADDAKSREGNKLYNWAVHFDLLVP
jgi:hypothetical protein